MKYIILCLGILFSFFSVGFAVESPQILDRVGESSESENNFRILIAKAIDENSIELMFTGELDTSENAVQAFIIEDKAMGTEIDVMSSEISPDNPQKVLVELGVDLAENTEYTVTVLDIQDTFGNTIESGIDAFVDFVTPESFEIPELNSASSATEAIQDENNNEEDPIVKAIETIISEETEDQEDAKETEQAVGNEEAAITQEEENIQENTTQEITSGKSGVNVEIDEVGNETTKAGLQNEKLPQTGPELWVLFGILAILGGVLYSNFFGKRES